MLKKRVFFGVIVLLIFVSVVGGVVYSFDLNAYRGQIVAQLEKASGLPTELDAIDLAWERGIVLRAKGLRVYPERGSLQTLASVEAVSAAVYLLPLLQKRVVIRSIEVHQPKINLQRATSQEQRLAAVAPVAAPAAAASPQAQESLPVQLSIQTVRVEEGQLTLPSPHPALRGPIVVEQLSLRLNDIEPGKPVTARGSATLAGGTGTVDFQARAVLPAGAIEAFEGTITQLQLGAWLDPAYTQHKIEGVVDVRLSGALPTLDPEAIQDALQLDYTVAVDKPRVVGVNWARELFFKLMQIPDTVRPGLMQQVINGLPDNLKQALQEKDTSLERIHATGRLAQRTLVVQPFAIEHLLVSVEAQGNWVLGQPLQLPAEIIFSQALTEAMLHSVRELEGLADAQRRITYPVVVFDRAPYVHVDPSYFFNKVVLSHTAGIVNTLIGEVLQRELGGEGAASAQTQPPATGAPGPQATPQTPSEAEMIQNMLQGILGQPVPAPSPPAQPPQPSQAQPTQPPASSPQSQQRPASDAELIGNLLNGVLQNLAEPREGSPDSTP
jgi:hypothetical protein